MSSDDTSPSCPPESVPFDVFSAAALYQAQRVEELNENIEFLTQAIRERPTRAETARKRRILALAMLIFGTFLIFLHDEHVERCSPGSEVKAIVEEFLTTPPGQRVDIAELQKIGSAATPDTCGMAFPLHSHDDEIPWPNKNNGVGFVIYSLAFAVVCAWAFRGSPKSVNKRRRATDIKA